MKNDYALRNVAQKLATDADQVEWDALLYGAKNIDGALEDEHIASAMDDFERENVDVGELGEADLTEDSAAGRVYEELSGRKQSLGNAYPFEIEGNALIKTKGEHLTYIFCLAASLGKDIFQNRVDESEIARSIFEELASEYTKVHFGPFARSVHTGWPRSKLPKSFKDLALYLNKETGEWFWGPEAELSDQSSRFIKEAGIDFLTWLESPDARTGKLFITGQCTCQKNWWAKFKDIDPKDYGKWFNPVSYIEPVKAFCIPHRMVDSYLQDASRQAGLIYDRTRLAALASKHEKKLPTILLDEMREYVKTAVE